MVDKFLDLIGSTEKAIITGHKNPDGDCLGAIIGLQAIMAALGKEIECLIDGPLPDRLSFIDSEGIIIDVNEPASLIAGDADLAIVCDCASRQRLGAGQDYIEGKTIINIDHHIDNDLFGTHNYVFADRSSACEVIAEMTLGRIFVPHKAAMALAAGILYDTGGLRHQNTTPNTLMILANLQIMGADIAALQDNLFGSISREDFQRLNGYLQNMNFAAAGKIAWTAIPDSFRSKEISQRVIDELRNINGVEVALLFTAMEDRKTKLSLRSKSGFPVNTFAALWGGGGHVRAAGAELAMSLQEALETVIPQLVVKIDEWNN